MQQFFDSLGVLHRTPVIDPASGQSVTAVVDGYTTRGGADVAALFPDVPGGSRMAPLTYEMGFASPDQNVREMSQAEAGQLPINPILTTLVVGQLYRSYRWVDEFFRPSSPLAADGTGLATSESYTWPYWGKDHLAYHNTTLPERTPYGISGLSVGWLTGSLSTHGWASDITRRERALTSNFLSWATRKAALPMEIMGRWLQKQALDLLTDTTADATFATGHVMLKGVGTEWGGGGDLKADVDVAVKAILGKVSGHPSMIHVKFARDSFTAALNDPGFKANSAGVVVLDRQAEEANLRALAQYLGVGRCSVLDVTGPDGLPALADDTWIYYDEALSGQQIADFSTDYGTERWLTRFSPNDGVVQQPWRDNMFRTDLFAAIRQYELHVHNPDCGYLIRNCAP